MITALALMGTAGLVGVMIRASVFDIKEEYDFIKYFFMASTACFGLLLCE